MRHDFLGADIEMFHLIEHRIEHDKLRTGADQLLNFLRTFRGASPNRHPGSEIGVFVTPCKPVANAFFAALLVAVDGEIDSLAVTESCGIPLCIRKKLANHRRLTNESIGRWRARSHPTVAILHRAFERI